MASEKLHEQKNDLTAQTLDLHRAYTSLSEELEAVDWYNQRADVAKSDQLKAILIHNRNEEIEHACMLLEWLRRNQQNWHDIMKTYLFTEKDITRVEEAN